MSPTSLRILITSSAAAVLVAAVTFVLPSLALAGGVGDDDGNGKVRNADLQTRLEKIVKLGAPGALALVRDRKGVWIGKAGVSDKETGRAINTTDAWRMASVTKVVTASMVQSLARDGKLKLDDKIGAYLPGVVPLANKITIRHLLNHTSGIPDYFSGANAAWLRSAKEVSAHLTPRRPILTLIDDASKIERTTAPGRQHEYSNTNYLVLQLLIEKLAGKPFDEVVKEKVIDPLGLQFTGFPDADGQIPVPHLRGYVPGDSKRGPFTDDKKLVDVTDHHIFGDADGSLYANAENLSAILDALWAGRLIHKDDFAAMLDRLVSDHDGAYRYGLGIMALPQSCGRALYGHEGRDLGMFTLAFADRKNERQVILVINRALDEAPRIEDAALAFIDKVACAK
jgi:D-alanyl-D-alanine carboxypeptidase